MPDIATLGIAVDSSGVDKGKASLERFSNAAKHAEAATKGIASGSSGAARAAVAISSSADAATASLTRQAGAARQAAVAMNDNVQRMGGSFSGLAAQFQDIGVTAAMGMNPMIIGLQQGTQIAGQMEMAMQKGGSAASVFGQALTSLLSPVSLLSIGLTILAAAGLQMVDWPKSAAWALDMLADNLETIAPYAVTAAAALALIYAPSIIGGLVQLIALIARVGVAALTAAGSFTAAWLAAMGPLGWLVAGIAAVGTAAYLLRDEIKSAIGVDVVSIMKDAGNFIINSFEAAYSDVAFIWSNFGNMMGAAVVGGVNIAIRAINGLIERAIEGINKFVGIANPLMERAGFDPLGLVGSSFQLPELDNPYAGAFAKANAGHTSEIERIMGQDRLGQFGAAIGEGASAASGKLKELADWMTTVDDKTKKGSKGRTRGGKTEEEKYQDIIDGADRRIASLIAEQEALGMTEQAAAKLAYETEMLNQAQQKGIKLSATQRAELSSLAETMAMIETATEKAREAMEFAKDLTKGFFSDFRSGLENGKGLWASFADAALNALDKIADKLMDGALDALFKPSAGAGGGGGWLSGLLGIFGGGGFSANHSGNLGARWSDGGYTGAGGKYEPAGVVHKGEYVFSAAATRALGALNLDRMHRNAKGYAQGGLVGSAMPRVMPAANGNQPAAQSGNGRTTTVVISLADGLRAEIVGEASENTVKIVQQNNQAMTNYRQNGGN